MGALSWLVLFAALVAGGCVSGSDPVPRAVMLVTIDTMRADRSSAYGYERPTTPVLKELASRGVRFEYAYTVMPTTDPSHTSMLTGLHPSTHGIRRNGGRMRDPSVATLPAYFRGRGYVTSAVTARAHLDPQALGIAGFDHADAPVAPELTRDADQVLELVEKRFAEMPKGDWFFWVHLWEPHGPYDPPADLREKFYDGRLTPNGMVPKGYRVPPYTCGEGGVSDTTKRAVSGLYDAEIAAADRALGKLLAMAREYAPNGSAPLIVVTADHGESMGEHDKTSGVAFGHGRSLHQETIRVPLVLWWPDRLKPLVVRRPVSLVDLAATVRELSGGGAKSFGTTDRSLAGTVLAGEEPEPRPVVVERRRFSSSSEPLLLRRQFAWIDGAHKVIATDTVAGLDNAAADPHKMTLRSFDLAVDPHERVVIDTATSIGRELAEWRQARAAEAAVSSSPVKGVSDAASGGQEADPAKLENLRSLGYMD